MSSCFLQRGTTEPQGVKNCRCSSPSINGFTHSHSQPHTHPLTLTHLHCHIPSLTHTHTLTLTYPHTLPHSHPHIPSHTHIFTHSCPHIPSHTHTHLHTSHTYTPSCLLHGPFLSSASDTLHPPIYLYLTGPATSSNLILL